ncbi:hypothetical protein BOX15_Mlig008992g3 [Macrostomum lignano]|uniref:Uncharacterized protein n=2 Tax=Macrostomum lignano TaxID=282301 RepID=A0A267FXV3_9PLAT|nr:hypothetical protein BOX15_Mlig008992g3 [Macrostomum lignano]
MGKLIIDTDCGLDDANAILLALSHPDTQVLAITMVDGNTCLDNVVQNVLRVLRAAGRQDIPIYRGSACSMLNLPRKCASDYHGEDGLGDFPDHEPVSTEQLQQEHAVWALVRLLREHDDVDLVCLGPLTNLALAIRLEPALGNRIRRLCIMGGNYKGKGNITMTGEFNFYRDPEAAHVVLHDLTDSCQVTMVGWEVCAESMVTFETAEQLMLQGCGPKADFVRSIYANVLRQRLLPGFVFCDELAMACLLWPQVARQTERARFRVELAGHWCRGMAVPDWESLDTGEHQPMVTMVTSVDMTRFLDLMRACLNG